MRAARARHPPSVVWAKFEALAEGTRLATRNSGAESSFLDRKKHFAEIYVHSIAQRKFVSRLQNRIIRQNNGFPRQTGYCVPQLAPPY